MIKNHDLPLIGLIGGMSWASTVPYYRAINEGVQQRLGKLYSAPCLLWSINFHEMEKLQHSGQWDKAASLLLAIAQKLEQAGAKAVVICTNTMHKVAAQVQAGISIPLLHIADPTAEAIRRRGFARVGLIATNFTMEEDFYRSRLIEKYGLDVMIPDASDRERIHRIIYDELCLNEIVPSSRQFYLHVVEKFRQQGATAVILGCTEVGLLIQDGDAAIPFFDTVALHAEAAVDFICR